MEFASVRSVSNMWICMCTASLSRCFFFFLLLHNTSRSLLNMDISKCGSIQNMNARCIVGAFYTVKRKMKFCFDRCNENKKVESDRMRAKMKKRRHIHTKRLKTKTKLNWTLNKKYFAIQKHRHPYRSASRKAKSFRTFQNEKILKKTRNHFATDLMQKTQFEWKVWACVALISATALCFVFNAFAYRKRNFRIGGFKFSDLILCSSFDRSWNVKES